MGYTSSGKRLGYPQRNAFNPTQLQDLFALYLPGVGVLSTGGLVRQWGDQSGNARHLTQATEANQPALQSSGGILFDGSDDFLSLTGQTLNQPLTVYLLMKQVTWSANDRFFSGTGATVIISQTTSTPTISLNAGSAAAANNNLVVDTYGVVAAVFNGASSRIQVNYTTETTGNAGANNATGYAIGATTAGASASNIEVMGIGVFTTAHAQRKRDQVIGYFGQLGGVPL